MRISITARAGRPTIDEGGGPFRRRRFGAADSVPPIRRRRNVPDP